LTGQHIQLHDSRTLWIRSDREASVLAFATCINHCSGPCRKNIISAVFSPDYIHPNFNRENFDTSQQRPEKNAAQLSTASLKQSLLVAMIYRPLRTISFDFSTLADVDERLAELAVEVPLPSANYGTDHLQPLRLLGENWDVSPEERQLHAILAQGYSDLLIVLIEPVESYSNVDAEEVIATSDCLVELNDHIRLATSGARDIHSTCVFNVRPYRPKKFDEKARPMSEAYTCFGEMVRLLAPSVVLVAQCQSGNDRRARDHQLARDLSSSWATAGTMRLWSILGENVRIVNAFNPSCFLREDFVANWVEKRFSADLERRDVPANGLSEGDFQDVVHDRL